MTERKTVKFGDICREVKLTTKDPIEDGYERYIGLEHLDSGSLKIKRWGMIAEDNPSFTRVFKKGQILFGKRRPYLKKAAIAEFDGICSGDIIVLEPTGNDFLPELLPFIVQSDRFWDWAVKTSSGSLSPRTKFKEIALLEMQKPSAEKQKSYSEMLIQQSSILQKYEDLIESLKNLLNSLIFHELRIINPFNVDSTSLPNEWKIKKLEQIAVVERGKFTPRPRNNPIYYEGKYPFIQTGDVGSANLFITEHSQTLNEKGLAVSKIFSAGTIFVTIAANIGDVAMATYDTAATDSVVAIKSEKGIDPVWLLFYMSALKAHLDWIATESAQKNINLATLRPLRIAVPPSDFQESIGKKLLSIRKYLDSLLEAKENLNRLLKGIYQE